MRNFKSALAYILVLAFVFAGTWGWCDLIWRGGQIAYASGLVASAYNLIQNGGTPLTKRSTLNCVAPVTCADDSMNQVTTVTSSGGGSATGNAVVSVTPVTVSANTTADQKMIELSLAAGYLNSLNQPFLFNAAGVYTTALAQTPTLTYKLKLCTVSGCGSGAVVTLASIVSGATLAGSTNDGWNFSFMGYTAATGATGNVEIHGPLFADLGALPGSAASVYNDTNAAVSGNIDLTAALFLDFTVATSSGNAGNAITQRAGAVVPFAATTAIVTSVQGLTGAVVVTDANLSTSDITTNNCSTSKHGFAPKAPNDATKFLNGLCAYATPAATPVAWDIGATFDGGGSAITSGATTYFRYVHGACTVNAWNVTVDTGTITIDVWKVASGTAIPTVANTITGSATPAIAANTAVHSTTLTGWTTAVAQNDIFGVSVTAVSGATTASVDVQCTQN